MDIKASLERILQAKDALARDFYRRLFVEHAEWKPLFANVDMERQAALLTMQLSVIEVFYVTGSPAAEKYLQVLGTKHSDRGVPREAYPPFGELLLETMARFHGDEWTEELARQWREALERAVAKMLEGYERRFSL